MKKYISIFATVAIAMLATSCQKEIGDKIETATPDAKLVDVTLGASSENQATKTQIDGKTLVWEASDELGVYDVNGVCQKFTTDAQSISGASASFKGQVAEGTETIYAVYPYESAVALADGKLSVKVPAVQTIGEGLNVAHGALTTVATGSVDAELAFKNVFSLLKVQVTAEDIVAINVCGTAIAGTAVVNPATGILESVAAAENSITVTYNDGQTAFPQGDYYIAVLPGAHVAGDFSIAMSRSNTVLSLFKESTKEFTLARNGGLDFGALDTKSESVFIIKDKASLDVFFTENVTTFAAGCKTIMIADVDYEGANHAIVNKDYAGTFDGRNHRIYNFVNDGNLARAGFLWSITKPGTLKNLCIGSSDYNFESKTGTYDGVSEYKNNFAGSTYTGLVGYPWQEVTIENVVNFAKVSVCGNAYLSVGGIAGRIADKSVIRNCLNFGEILVTSTYSSGTESFMIGGILGRTDKKDVVVDGCENHGKISYKRTSVFANELYVGGVVGYLANAGKMKIENCVNAADASFDLDLSQGVTGGLRFGGVFGGVQLRNGSTYPQIDINGCKNYAAITINSTGLGQSFIGGVMGATREGTRTYANGVAKLYKGNENHGQMNVTIASPAATSFYYVGGVSGNDNGWDTGAFEDCKNTAAINVTSAVKCFVGGIASKNFPGTHKNLVNTGNATIVNAYNAGGKVDNTINYGGIFSYSEAGTRLENCAVRGNITTSSPNPDHNTWMFIGGFFGRPNGALTMADCSFGGAIDASQKNASKNVSGPFIGAFNTNTACEVTFEGTGNKIIAGTTVKGATHPEYVAGETVSTYTWLAGTYNAKTLVGTVSVVAE